MCVCVCVCVRVCKFNVPATLLASIHVCKFATMYTKTCKQIKVCNPDFFSFFYFCFFVLFCFVCLWFFCLMNARKSFANSVKQDSNLKYVYVACIMMYK